MDNNAGYTKQKIYKIMYFLDYGKNFGGAVNTLLRQAFLMKKAGQKIIIFFSDYLGNELPEKNKEIFMKQGIKYEWATYQITSHPEDIDIICMDSNYEKLKQKIMLYNPDILHSVQINLCVELISRELNIPHIMNIYQFHPDFFSIHYTNVFPHYHICDSWYWAKRWNKYLDTDFTCIRTIINDSDRLEKKIVVGDIVRYICVGTLCERKNQLNVIKAFHRALLKGILGKLSIYGEDKGRYAETCKAYIQENNLSEWIHINGYCYDMENIYKQSDVLVCGSVWESYPNVISESMAHGLIIISTPVAGVPELLKDGVNAYLSDDASSEAISRKILELNGDIGKKHLETIRENSYKTFIQNHSSDKVLQQLIEYYAHVTKDNKKSSNICIDNIREKFSVLINQFYQNFTYFTETDKISLKLWYLYHIKEIIVQEIQREKLFYIWGAGRYGVVVKELLEIFFPQITISGFIDSNRVGKFFEYIIYNPKDIIDRKDVIIFIAVVDGQSEIINQLNINYKIFNQDYFILSPRSW